jgi:DNA mismatch endonuclease, patch repair protein
MDMFTVQRRREIMHGIRGADTQAEIIVRQRLHPAGFGFRLHSDKLPGKPDLVLPKYRAAVFVHGCF